MLKKVECPDDKTIQITLKEPDTEFLAYLIVAIVPEHAKDLDKQPVGTAVLLCITFPSGKYQD